MQQNPNRVDWASWLAARPDDLRRPDKVIVRLGDGWHCQLCSSRVTGSRSEHHLVHMLELDAGRAGAKSCPGRSRTRSADRRIAGRSSAAARAGGGVQP